MQPWMWHCCWRKATAALVSTSSFACSFKSCHSMDFFTASVDAIVVAVAITSGADDANVTAAGCTAGLS